MVRLRAVEVLFEDACLLVVNKPAGLLSIPGRDIEEPSVIRLTEFRDRNLYVVHRLDRDTSGVLLFAKDEESHRALSMQFEERKVVKKYLALVIGRPLQESFSISFKLSVDAHGHAVVSASGKVSETHCRIVEAFSRFSLLEAHPVTGRHHQIRVHLAHIGHPLAVDPVYGSAAPLTIADIKPGFRKNIMSRNALSDEEETPALLLRTPLHAASISFSHPLERSAMQVTADMPKDMQATLKQLRKWSR